MPGQVQAYLPCQMAEEKPLDFAFSLPLVAQEGSRCFRFSPTSGIVSLFDFTLSAQSRLVVAGDSAHLSSLGPRPALRPVPVF